MSAHGIAMSVVGIGLWFSLAEYLGLEYDEMVKIKASADSTTGRVSTMQSGCAVYYRRRA